jgi:hypothetical protein
MESVLPGCISRPDDECRRKVIDLQAEIGIIAAFLASPGPHPGGFPPDPSGQPTRDALMRHYEIVFIVHPDQSEQVPGMIERYRQLVTSAPGASIASRTGDAGNSPSRSRKSTRRITC